jgi:hypothetical protein
MLLPCRDLRAQAGCCVPAVQAGQPRWDTRIPAALLWLQGHNAAVLTWRDLQAGGLRACLQSVLRQLLGGATTADDVQVRRWSPW